MTAPHGRRGLPPQDDDAPRGRRCAPEPELPPPTPTSPSSGARRGIVEDEPEADDTRRAWLWIIALGAAIALTVGVMWLVFGTRGDDGGTAQPAPIPSASETTGPAEEDEPTQPASPTTEPPAAPLPSNATSPAVDPAVPAPSASPGTSSVEPSLPADLVELDDGATFTLLTGWEMYADQRVQNDRRLVRLRDTETDVRIQAVTLTTVTGPLDEACLDLVADHRRLYTGVAEGLPVGVAVSGEGEGISCNFTGTRVSDGVPAMVEFTLLQRGEATLVFRDTIPTAVPVASTAREQLVAMECEAATSFGVAVDQCALIPAPADG